MAKGKKQSRTKKSKRAATDIDTETGQPLLIPPPRDLAHHLNAYGIAKAKVDKANQDLQHVCKAADAAGVDMKAVKAALAIAKKDPLVAKAYMTQMSMVFQETGAGVQINVHEAKFEDAVAEAKVKGFSDGKAGRDKDHPWMKGSPAARQYEESYAEGQLENMPIDPKAKAEAKGRKLALVE